MNALTNTLTVTSFVPFEYGGTKNVTGMRTQPYSVSVKHTDGFGKYIRTAQIISFVREWLVNNDEFFDSIRLEQVYHDCNMIVYEFIVNIHSKEV